MKCGITFKDISLYIDGRCTDKKKAYIEDHLLSCNRCKRQIEQLRVLKISLGNLTPIEESAGFDFEFNRLLQDRLDKQKVHHWNRKVQDRLADIRDNLLYPTPVSIKIAISFVVILTLVIGTNMYLIQRQPVIEFISGDAKVYRFAYEQAVTARVNMRLKPGDKIESNDGAILNILCRNKYKARIKDAGLMVISQLPKGIRDVDANFSISYGKLQINTSERFKGSRMRIYTPACNAEVVGTAFMVRVFPEPENKTWIGVLKGRVKVISKVHPLKVSEAREVTAYLSSGQKTVLRPYGYPAVPELFSEKEWHMMQELYQLRETPQVILLIDTEADRVEELFRPAPLYIPDIMPRAVPLEIKNIVGSITKAVREGRIDIIKQYLERLEDLLKVYQNPEYEVEVLMFIASHYHYIKDYANAIRVFDKVIGDYPDSLLVSLAQCAIGTIYQDDLKDTKKAQEAFSFVISRYPDSIDAIKAREALASTGK